VLVGATSGGLTSLWFLARGTGVVSLLLLTLVIALGVAGVQRAQPRGWPRFVIDSMHRNVALLAVAFLAVHVLTSALDPFVPIKLADAVLPFTSQYRPLWVGLGAVAFDLLIALVATSVWRRRLGYRAWRGVHWIAYACWPVALVHGLGTGTDASSGWMLLITAACAGVVLGAVVIRAVSGWPEHLSSRVGGLAGATAVPVFLAAWLPGGPLGANWAKRAGTPASVLAAARGVGASGGRAARSGRARPARRAVTAATPPRSFTAAVVGQAVQSTLGAQAASVHILLAVRGQRMSALHILLVGQPLQGGGLSMTSSSVTFGTAAQPHVYRGTVTALNGATIAATVTDGAGHAYALLAQLKIDPTGQTVTGTLSATVGRSHQ
jgi:sulfoxide reductase heme-binding subunit YedZ